ncbi:methyltransferase [Candidatus Woesearchaeota archaeon]|nr:methyltransferase [Candidatus Woesearchaeota archaeon]
MNYDKKKLSILLSRLKEQEILKLNLEQYQTEGEIAGDILWKAFLNNDIKGKTIADLGCGNGIFGIGALLMEAKKVYFLDKDIDAIDAAKENYKRLKLKNGIFLNKDINEFEKKADVVLMNPPFGVQKEHNDKIFLEKAMEISQKIYSLHKIESKEFIKKLAETNNFSVSGVYDYNLLIKQKYKFHKRKSYYVKIGCWILEKC